MTAIDRERALRLGAATLHEAAGKIGALPAAIRPMAPGFAVCGSAFPVSGPPVDNLWLHRAIAAAPEGAVLVASVGGAHEAGYWGEIMSTAARRRRLGGLVIDGFVRDVTLLAEIGFPVFARGLSIRGTGKDFGARGTLGEPVIIGDVVIAAGDLVLGDADGVVAIPAARVAETMAAADERAAKEAAVIARIEAGETTLAIYGWPAAPGA